MLIVGLLVYLMVRPPRHVRERRRAEKRGEIRAETDPAEAEQLWRLVDRMESRLEVLERALADQVERPAIGRREEQRIWRRPRTGKRKREEEMNVRGKRFEVDRANGKLLGVCAGIANHTGVDATIVRIGLVVVAVIGTFPWTLIAYGDRRVVGKPRAGRRATRRVAPSREESRERMRDLDLRMQAIETYVTSSNSSLAREIEDLR